MDLFTRRDDSALPPVIPFAPNVWVITVPAGPAHVVSNEALLPCMAEFGDGIAACWAVRTRPYDVVHANFLMSGQVGLRLREEYGVPLVVTLHAPGKVGRLHQGSADGFPAERIAIEEALVANADRLIAGCPQDRDELVGLYGADEERIYIVPCAQRSVRHAAAAAHGAPTARTEAP